VRIDIALRLAGGPFDRAHVRLEGQPAAGGVAMSSGEVTLGTAANPSAYQGPVGSLDGANIGASVTDAAGGSLALQLQLQPDPSGTAISGTVSGQP
jgi:hypothetical protein